MPAYQDDISISADSKLLLEKDLEAQARQLECRDNNSKRSSCKRVFCNIRNLSLFLTAIVLLNVIVVLKADQLRDLCHTTLSNNDNTNSDLIAEVFANKINTEKYIDDSMNTGAAIDYKDNADF